MLFRALWPQVDKDCSGSRPRTRRGSDGTLEDDVKDWAELVGNEKWEAKLREIKGQALDDHRALLNWREFLKNACTDGGWGRIMSFSLIATGEYDSIWQELEKAAWDNKQIQLRADTES